MNGALTKMRRGEVALGLGASLVRGNAAPLIAKAAGCDWLFIDMEHSALTLREASEMCMGSLACGVTPIVRCRINALTEAARVLDNGALGIVVPHVDTSDEAHQIVRALRYMPLGERAWGGSAPAFGFKPPNADRARAEAEKQTLVIATIESKVSVANAEAIAAIPGIDILLFGATDLSLDLGIAGQTDNDEIFAAFTATAQACKKHNKILGFGGATPQVAKRFFMHRPHFVLAGMDLPILLGAAEQRVVAFRELF